MDIKVRDLKQTEKISNSDKLMILVDDELNLVKNITKEEFLTNIISKTANNALIQETDGNLYINTSKIADSVTALDEKFTNNIIAVDEKFTNTIGDLNNLTTEDKTNLVAAINEANSVGGDSRYLNKTQITNCLLEVPERLKITFEKNLLTLKSGSVVTVPNGFESDGITRKFDEVTITQDVSYSGTSYNGAVLLYYMPETNVIYGEAIGANSVTGSTAGSGINTWYDLNTNRIKRVLNGSVRVSLPLGAAILRSTVPYIAQVPHIFNGFGFMGQATFVLSGVKALFADGRNTDGTLKNKEIVNKTCTILTLDNQVSFLGQLKSVNNTLGLYGYGVRNYFEQETAPSGFNQYAVWYNTRENQVYDTSDGGVTWNKMYNIILPNLTKSGSASVITDISMPYAVKIADINEVKTLISMPARKALNGYTRLPNGILIQWGYLASSGDPATVTINFPTAFSGTNYGITCTPRMTTNYNDWSFGWVTRTATSCSLFCKTQNQPISWIAIGY